VDKLQEGIFYNREKDFQGYKGLDVSDQRNKTFAVLFIRFESCTAEKVGNILKALWKRYNSLKEGISEDIPGCKFPNRSLSVLFGYGPKIFELSGIKKKIPKDMKGMQFLPSEMGGEPILADAGIEFAKDTHENLGLSQHVIIQLIGTSQLAVYRSILETINYLYRLEEQFFTVKFYTGFQRDDRRSWLGFHDEISNLNSSKEARDVIAINKNFNHLRHDDYWTENGTYLAFLRTRIDIELWNTLNTKEQELIVGRDKESGRPIIGVDSKGNPILDENCPSLTEINNFSRDFHDHPDFFKTPSFSKTNHPHDLEASIRILNQSHIGRTRHMEQIEPGDPSSNRIFRQGFEFIETSSDPKFPLSVGQNFVSFQNDPARIFSILTSLNWLGKANFGGPDGMKLLTVTAAGVFLVPPNEEPFPGACMFL
jgi:Dyp-type peroxidase family